MYPMDGDFLHFDVHVLTLLANSQGNQIPSVETEQFQNCLPFKMFQVYFKQTILITHVIVQNTI